MVRWVSFSLNSLSRGSYLWLVRYCESRNQALLCETWCFLRAFSMARSFLTGLISFPRQSPSKPCYPETDRLPVSSACCSLFQDFSAFCPARYSVHRIPSFSDNKSAQSTQSDVKTGIWSCLQKYESWLHAATEWFTPHYISSWILVLL